jgi:hypothetical protein
VADSGAATSKCTRRRSVSRVRVSLDASQSAANGKKPRKPLAVGTINRNLESLGGFCNRVPELDSPPGSQRTVFVLPPVKNKNRQARVVVLNDAAQTIVERKRGQHPVYVFTWVNDDGVRDRTGRMRNTGWGNARNRAADGLREFRIEPPQNQVIV